LSETLEIKGKNQMDHGKNFYNGAYCIECGSTDIICDETRGETICNNCGLVIKEHMVDMGPEWRSYTAIENTAIEILAQAKEEGITTGKVPTGLAATALYIAGILEDERRTQQEISRVGQVTEITIRNRYREFIENLEIAVAI